MKRFAQRAAVTTSAALPAIQSATFFGKGWDNASLDTVFRYVVRKPNVEEQFKRLLATHIDSRSLDIIRKRGDTAAKNKIPFKLYLPPHLGDPHRLLKAYSLTAYPILDEVGKQVEAEIAHGVSYPAFADPDDDFSKVVIPDVEVVSAVAVELLTTLGWEASPRAAAAFLESLYRGAEIPDYVFETPRVVESKF